MAMAKLPILNYDPSPEAVIAPFRDEGYQFPAKVLLAFVPMDHLETFYHEYHAEPVGELETFSNRIVVHQIRFHGQLIGVCPAVIGAPASAQIVDFLIAYGAKQIIAVGSCGVLTDQPENALLVVQEALRDEGTSYHYLPAAPSIVLDTAMAAAIQTSLESVGQRAKLVKTWTNDAFFRETPALIRQYTAQGYEVVEMECAALAAIAQFRGAQYGQILFTADSLANTENYDPRDFGAASHTRVLTLGVNCLADL
ncbi:hypothetical protein L248_2245 [Schleiferilactobacillus shenzhenensis LY-73]|uniref:Uridine phosphorylase n=2 Tax=Schleiferilactobacillus shenzhenensis TaxID=1231337 RepID=U4TQC7_9LACO|nr:hypothetical protein L248_2245 [Schleiferilactobacillus shenzhenensis LY-73]